MLPVRPVHGPRGGHITSVFALSLFVIAIVGCSNRSSQPMAPAAPLLRASPADGASSVRLDAAVILDFGTAVDRATVESGLHLMAESDMLGECPDSAMGTHGTMDAIMNDPRMLRHMDQVHATRGAFSWNGTGTVCTFTPDSLMRSQTRYMIHMSGAMLEMMRGMGGMMGGGAMNGAGDMMTHFQTMTSDGHSGHH